MHCNITVQQLTSLSAMMIPEKNTNSTVSRSPGYHIKYNQEPLTKVLTCTTPSSLINLFRINSSSVDRGTAPTK